MVQLEEIEEQPTFAERLASVTISREVPPGTPASSELPANLSSNEAPDFLSQATSPVVLARSNDSGDDARAREQEAARVPAGNSGEEFQDARDEATGDGKEDVDRGPKDGGGDAKRGDDEKFEDSMTEDELRQLGITEAEALKLRGNAAYGKKEFADAMRQYSAALDTCPVHEDSLELRAACHGNIAMCLICLEDFAEAVKACSAALELKPTYVKVLLRRAQAYEALDKLEEAMTDCQKVLELDPDNSTAKKTIRKLQPIVEERREKLKEEMLGKLKDLGNSVLGHFGLSLDNFKAVKDPATGSYSINFQS